MLHIIHPAPPHDAGRPLRGIVELASVQRSWSSLVRHCRRQLCATEVSEAAGARTRAEPRLQGLDLAECGRLELSHGCGITAGQVPRKHSEARLKLCSILFHCGFRNSAGQMLSMGRALREFLQNCSSAAQMLTTCSTRVAPTIFVTLSYNCVVKKPKV